MVWQHHGCSPVLQRPLRNKVQATERYANRSSWYLCSNTHCKRGSNHDITAIAIDRQWLVFECGEGQMHNKMEIKL